MRTARLVDDMNSNRYCSIYDSKSMLVVDLEGMLVYVYIYLENCRVGIIALFLQLK
jgi:hypothetical protein